MRLNTLANGRVRKEGGKSTQMGSGAYRSIYGYSFPSANRSGAISSKGLTLYSVLCWSRSPAGITFELALSPSPNNKKPKEEKTCPKLMAYSSLKSIQKLKSVLGRYKYKRKYHTRTKIKFKPAISLNSTRRWPVLISCETTPDTVSLIR